MMKTIRNRAITIAALLVLVVFPLLTMPGPVKAAAWISVNTVADEYNTGAACSLREAIVAANRDAAFGGCPAGSGADTIYLPPGLFKLTIAGANEDASATGDLDITSSLSIIGSGTNVSNGTGSMVYAEAGFSDRIFHVKSPANQRINVTFSNLVIKGGDVNQSPGGGGLLIDNANAALNRVFVTENKVSSALGGGGITNFLGSNLVVDSSTFTLNTSGSGGAIYNRGNVDIENSLLYSNTAGSSGGGLDNSPPSTGGSATIRNSTIASNFSSLGSGVSNSGAMTIINATIANNTGPGMYLYVGSSLTISNTIVAQVYSPNCIRDSDDVQFVSAGYNLVFGSVPVPSGKFECNWTSTGSTTNVDPLLTATLLYDDSPTGYYGFTSTSSPAIDQIPQAKCPAIDQRLHGRPAVGKQGNANQCDIGAFEVNGSKMTVFLPAIMR